MKDIMSAKEIARFKKHGIAIVNVELPIEEKLLEKYSGCLAILVKREGEKYQYNKILIIGKGDNCMQKMQLFLKKKFPGLSVDDYVFHKLIYNSSSRFDAHML
ncbi:MAG: hypothetical protein Q7S73_02850 [bacterium]|nr:hypothetical protein [bacterium]